MDRSDPEHAFDHEISFQVGKKQLGDIIDRCIQKYGFTISAEVLDSIKALGYKYSTKGAITISVADMTVPSKKYSGLKRSPAIFPVSATMRSSISTSAVSSW